MSSPKNRVLTEEYRRSKNFYTSDRILHSYLNRCLSENARRYIGSTLVTLGKVSAVKMDSLSMAADQNPPKLKKRDQLGNDINEVEFHPAYWELMDIAAESEIFHLKYHPQTEGRFRGSRHRMGFALGQLYAMSELGQYCPHCMTDGAAYLIEQFSDSQDKKRLLPKLGACEGNNLYSGAMFLTEKSGGSDVGTNLTEAKQIEGDKYQLNGEKWFCSNVNADVMMVLARTDSLEKGTRGLSLFLVEKYLQNGERNPMDIVRLKDKLGVRSMATGEVLLQNTIGKRLGEEDEGFKLMAPMINISRNYNSVAALAGFRRALIEAWQYLNHRKTFGKKATEHALIRENLYELGSHYLGTFLLVWRTLRAMDTAEVGDEKEQQLLRILTPMAKWWSAEQSVYAVRECMELMGGNGYIEDFVMPKLLRDVNVLPIWEGSGNIIVLDILRAARKSDGLKLIFKHITDTAATSEEYGSLLNKQLSEVKSVWQLIGEMEERDYVEATAKPLFKKLITLFQITLLIREKKDSSSERFDIALSYLTGTFNNSLRTRTPPSLDNIAELIGWDY